MTIRRDQFSVIAGPCAVESREATGLAVVTELVDVRHAEAVAEAADVIQIGARNMQNFALLSEAGRTGLPVLVKRGASATLAELLLAAEHVLSEGNEQVILCERGIRTFEDAYRGRQSLPTAGFADRVRSAAREPQAA